MTTKPIWILLPFLALACSNNDASPRQRTPGKEQPALSAGNPYQKVALVPLPGGFHRTRTDSNSFAQWLRDVKLKKDRAVHIYNGSLKNNQSAQFAVLDISVGKQDLQQCADAVMRLRAEYLFSKKQYEAIIFTDNEGTAYNFSTPFTRDHFDQYLLRVFGMCGSASLSKQLKKINDPGTIEPGDVLIRGGFPGHAVMVMDVAVNDAGKKIFLLAQSYMPAQDIHILQNPVSDELSPWYEVNDDETIVTPEYLFRKDEWKRW